MKEKGKSSWLAPSCASLKPRLYQIGVTEFSGEPEELNIAVLAGCLAGELYNRVSPRPAAARKIAWELKKLLGQKKTEKAALYLLLRYRMAGLDIPDLLLWAMANREVSRPFLGHFLNRYRELVKGGGRTVKKIYLYKPPGEEAPFLQFLKATEPKMRKKLQYGLRCLACFPEYMTEPHVKHFSIERYNRLYEYRERIRILVRVIFTLDENGDIILLYPFVKKHDRNTMQALEASVHIMEKIRDSPDSIIEYHFEQEEKG